MRWPTVHNLILALALSVLTMVLPSCSTKQRVIEVNSQDIAAHQRHQVADIVLNDTFTVLQFVSTDSGVQLVPIQQIQRSARGHAAAATTTTDTTTHHNKTTTQKQRTTVMPSCPWFLSETFYMLILAILFLLLVTYIARKL